ncbi:SUKH-4 family immunity protein [Maribacter sp. 1_MG-2023]|uniref:SUKH-4 family immunity protein n=1 Tax=Maribacter sp. 1_MG-2023 TaxID=3062677 RepID=UPI00260D03DF|nr:SUKH-4 family immunity protein [Maribacter sp. 1_MG-2023]MDO6471702.1 SUKH-4 family immunity protein [Maribacter sp. 1_MG-2023]
MKPEEFKKLWTSNEEKLNPISTNRLNELGLRDASIQFLNTVGLPESAAPFLSFVTDSDDLYKGIHKLTKIYEFLEPEFDKYIVIGSCSDGDPIVVNTESEDRIEYLDHEDYFSPKPFNSNFSSLTDSLIAYKKFIDRVLKENGEDAIMNSNFSDEQFEALKLELLLADSKIIKQDGFWLEQIEMELEMRKDFRNE